MYIARVKFDLVTQCIYLQLLEKYFFRLSFLHKRVYTHAFLYAEDIEERPMTRRACFPVNGPDKVNIYQFWEYRERKREIRNARRLALS